MERQSHPTERRMFKANSIKSSLSLVREAAGLPVRAVIRGRGLAKSIKVATILVLGLSCCTVSSQDEKSKEDKQNESVETFFATPRTLGSPVFPQDTTQEQRLSEREARIKAIEQRIELIREIIAKNQAELRDRPTEDPERQAEETPSTTTPTPTQPDSRESSKENIASTDFNNTEQAQPATNKTEPEPVMTAQSKTNAVVVVSSPVNSLELANSLFLTGHYAQALKSYEALLSDDANNLDRDWLRLLAANGYRIRREIPKAERLYREVTSSKNIGYPTDHAKWYLDHLSRRKLIDADFEMIDAELHPFMNKTRTK
ncbi:MAG TPA: hypothetical protein PKD64_07095 [Pirellulaceae bacterium]|nr:hypothetical protein [Pirellulaceae bacterium]HMO91950.1 hypothetical protein [Pirellulaceae bacterium]HMP68749.1 hypothetical protein [Pirellulaceae bacterium]